MLVSVIVTTDKLKKNFPKEQDNLVKFIRRMWLHSQR